MHENLTIIDHPLVQHKLSLMRDKETSTRSFRILIRETGTLLAYEVTKDLPLITKEIETPLMKMNAPFLEGKNYAWFLFFEPGTDCSTVSSIWFLLPEWGTLDFIVIPNPGGCGVLPKLPELIDNVW